VGQPTTVNATLETGGVNDQVVVTGGGESCRRPAPASAHQHQLHASRANAVHESACVWLMLMLALAACRTSPPP